MKKGEVELVVLGLVYWFVLNVLFYSNEFLDTTGYLFSLLFYFVLVYIGISHYKMNDKSIYISLMAVFSFNIIVSFLTALFIDANSVLNVINFFFLLFGLIIGFVLVTGYIKIVRYFTEEIKKINN